MDARPPRAISRSEASWSESPSRLSATAQARLLQSLHELRRDGPAPVSGVVSRVLSAVHAHLGLDIALVTEVATPRGPVRYVDTAQGRRRGPMPAPRFSGEVRVPVRLPSGATYGQLVLVAGPRRVPAIAAPVLALLADLLGGWLGEQEADARDRARRQQRIQRVLTRQHLAVVFQPVVDLVGEGVVGYEALARFPSPPRRGPDAWFVEAAEAGLAVPLELSAIRLALRGLPALPAHAYLAVNASPAALLSANLAGVLREVPAERLVVELTEHARVADVPQLRRALAPLRAAGTRLAVDDTGAGYAGLDLLLALEPDIVKLDIALCRGVAGDPAREAMVWALCWFARKTGAALVAEGIERPEDLHVLTSLGVRYGQGFLLGRPGPLPAAEAVDLLARPVEAGRPGRRPPVLPG